MLAAGDSLVGTVVASLADDGLRVRSAPRVGADSYKFEPLLPVGSLLYVLDGPVSASGYAWYDVIPLTSPNLPRGWVASADRDGEPWVEVSAFDCPRAPTSLRSLAALPPGVGLLCFPGAPIGVDASLVSCNCDVDGSWYTPSWFLGGGSPILLVEPEVTTVSESDQWFGLNLDPAGEHPDNLPVGGERAGEVVHVIGIFDHPAAASCTLTEPDGEPVPSQGCRLLYAVTDLFLYGP